VPPETGVVALWPLRPDGTENTWQLGTNAVKKAFEEGTARLNSTSGRVTVNYLRNAEKRRIEAGEITVMGRDDAGALILRHAEGAVRITRPRTVWVSAAHDAGLYGSTVLKAMVPASNFPFPKSLYAVEDTLRFFVREKPHAVIVDFFAGSGTTAHAVMRLNREDGGRRQSISITNNEVSADEQHSLRVQGLRPGDSEWEQLGICSYVTKPRVEAAISGLTQTGEPIRGDYKFTDEAPMAEGLSENAEYFTLTYESPLRIASHRDFERVAPLLWMRAGSRGRRIGSLTKGWDVADTYGVLADLDQVDSFVEAMGAADSISLAVVITDEDRLFESVVRRLPEHVEPVRLYDAYLRTFELESGRGAR
jgi:adenine-specific DNA-methyltransferase